MLNFDIRLQDILREDIEVLLEKIERSFRIQFKPRELAHVRYFGELCDHIIAKIHLENSYDCTLQQAFYKLRNSIAGTLNIEHKNISPDSRLADLMPEKNRKETVARIETDLGFKIGILRPPTWVTTFLFWILMLSIIGLFFLWPVALACIFITLALMGIAKNMGTDLSFETVGEVARNITRTNYRNARRNPETFNKKEIENIIVEWFSEELDIDKALLTRTEPLPEN